jgi:hypothetical protein
MRNNESHVDIRSPMALGSIFLDNAMIESLQKQKSGLPLGRPAWMAKEVRSYQDAVLRRGAGGYLEQQR